MLLAPERDPCQTAADVMAAARQALVRRKAMFPVATVKRDIIDVRSPDYRAVIDGGGSPFARAEEVAAADPASPLPRLTVALIVKVAAKVFGLTLAEITGPSRRRVVVYPRQVAMYVARTLTGCSLPEIGRRFGGRDHTTALHACNRIERRRKVEPGVATDVLRLVDAISATGARMVRDADHA